METKKLIAGLLYGGRLPLYVCRSPEGSCVNLSKQMVQLNRNNSLLGLVNKKLKALLLTVEKDTPLSIAERYFVNSTRIPILKFIMVMAKTHGNVGVYGKIIAEDLLMQYLEEALRVIAQSFSVSHYTDSVQQSMIENINAAKLLVNRLQINAYEQLNSSLALVQHVKAVEDHITQGIMENF